MENLDNINRDVNLIYSYEGDSLDLTYVSMTDYKSHEIDGNHGLPNWFFDGSYISIQFFHEHKELDFTGNMGISFTWPYKEGTSVENIGKDFSDWALKNF